MWLEYFWSLLSWIYVLEIKVITTYSPKKGVGNKHVAFTPSVCRRWWTLPLLPKLPRSPFIAFAEIVLREETSWKWIMVGVSRPVQLQRRSSVPAGKGNLTPIHIAPFLSNEDVLWETEYIWHCIYHSCLLWTELFYRQTHCSLTY